MDWGKELFGSGKAFSFDDALRAEGVTGRLADVARSIYQQESASGKNTSTSYAGAVGHMQIIPATFQRMADRGWDINNPEHNMRAGLRYIKLLNDQANGDPRLIAAGYYGGEVAIQKAAQGVAVSDPVNPRAPNTLQYAEQVAARVPKQSAPNKDWNSELFGAEDFSDVQASSSSAPKKTLGQMVEKEITESVPVQAARGIARGVQDVGQTARRMVFSGFDRLADNFGPGATNVAQTQAARDAASKQQFQESLPKGDDLDKLVSRGTAQVGRIGGNIAATLPLTSAFGAGVGALGLTGIGNAIRTGGMSTGATAATGVKATLRDLATRTAGGAAAGGIAAGAVDPESAGTGAAIGAALPGALKLLGSTANAAGRAVRGGTVSPEVAQLAQRAKELGINIPADRLVDSRPMNAVASGLNYVPFSGRAATESLMEKQLNTAASRLIGQNNPNMTKALRDASVDLGAKFDRVLQNTAVKVDNNLLSGIAAVEQTAKRELGADGLRAITGQIDEILSKGGSGALDGQAAYNIKRALDRIGRRNTPEAFHALELKRELMDALNRSLGAKEAAAFAETRRQYGNMIALEKIARNGAEGELSVARLSNMRNINNQPLQELADIAAQFVRARENPHGAMQRAVAALTVGTMGGPMGLAATATGGRGLNALLNSNVAREAMLTGRPNALKALSDPGLYSLAYRAAPLVPANR